MKISRIFCKKVFERCGAIFLCLASFSAFNLSTFAAQDYPKAASNSKLKAVKISSVEEAKWWQEVLTASDLAVAAGMRKQGAIVKAFRKAKFGTTDFNVLPQNEQAILDSEVSATSSRFWDLLKEGKEKSYSPPISDSETAIPLNRPMPFYTDQARAKKIIGMVKLRVEFLADGKIGEVKVIKPLYSDLDKKAEEAIRRFLFIPAVKDGMFVSTTQDLEVGFTLRDK